MNDDQAMQEAIERSEMGWSRDEARQTLAESMTTITIASRLARQAVAEIDRTSRGIADDLTDLKQLITTMKAEGISSGRHSGTCTRLQANAILTCCNKLLACLDVKDLVRMSLDLTNQSRIFLDMMAKIDIRYGEEDKVKQEDITRYLTTEQLIIVNEWIGENKHGYEVNITMESPNGLEDYRN